MEKISRGVMKIKIEWADYSWNPVTGCTRISTGCKNCYAERIAKRFWNRTFEEVVCHEDRLLEPKIWIRSRNVFVCSMSDLFHIDVPDKFIEQVFYVMAKGRHHNFILLTKRPARMMEFMNGHHECVQSHVWLGVSVENQEMADERIPLLLQTPAVIRFVSVEPMLEKIELQPYLEKLDWVICGAESGQGARPFDMGWAKYLKQQCVMVDVPFFLKQVRINGEMVKLPLLDGRRWAEFPKQELPEE